MPRDCGLTTHGGVQEGTSPCTTSSNSEGDPILSNPPAGPGDLQRSLTPKSFCGSSSRKGPCHKTTHVHSSNIIFIGLPDFLHNFFLSLGTSFNTAFNCNGPFRIIECQVLQSANETEAQLIRKQRRVIQIYHLSAMTSKRVEFALQRAQYQFITGLKTQFSKNLEKSRPHSKRNKNHRHKVWHQMVEMCLGATQGGNHHALQEHELQSSATPFSFTLHTSPTNREGAFRHPRNTDHKELSVLENSSGSLKDGGGEKAQSSVKLQESLQILITGKPKAVCESTFAVKH